MHTLSKNALCFAMALSALAGCVDAIAFMQLGGYFVSFMSGNSTRLAVDLAHGHWRATGMLAAIIACFVAGAAIGAAVKPHSDTQYKTTKVLMLVTAFLFSAALCDSAGLNLPAMLMIALAMGMENSALQSNGGHVIGVTYMTGTLVKIGQRIAMAFDGGDALSWLPYFLLWVGLISGGFTGALLFTHYGVNALWFAAAWATCLVALQRRNR